MPQKLLYYLTSFLVGLCIMGVEMSATRLLSPYFGSTNMIWTVIISLIMVGLCAGNYLGGRLADRFQTPGPLFACIAAGGIFVALTPLLSMPVISGGLKIAASVHTQNGDLAAAVAASVILFVPPIMLMGMVSPYLAKLCVSDLRHTGVILGRLQALSTVGCIIGSVLPTFFLIPWIGTKLSFAVFAALLFVPCMMHWLTERMRMKATIGAGGLLLAVAAAFFAGGAISPDESIYETESSYQYLRVYRRNDTLHLSTGLRAYVQSVRYDNPNLLSYSYITLLATIPELLAKKNTPADMLVIGYGGGVLASLLEYHQPNVRGTFVEIDPEMVRVAREYFHANPKDRVIVDDGRRFLQSTYERYDIIAMDAYHDMNIPVNLVTHEFFDLCAQKLRPGGMVAVNIAMAGDGTNAFCQALGETMRQSFNHVTFIRIPHSTSAVFLGSDAPLPFSTAISHRRRNWPLWPMLYYICLPLNHHEAPAGGPIMTDDRNNAEMLQIEAHSLMGYENE